MKIYLILLFFCSSVSAQSTKWVNSTVGWVWVYNQGTYADSAATAQSLASKEGLAVAATPATTGTMTTTMTSALQTAFTITPTGACTFNASGGTAGQRMTFIITTSGTSAFVLTWSTNFKTTGTLSTGTVSGKVFCINFICKDGTNWYECGRTTAM